MVALLLTAGCQRKEPPFSAPPIELRAGHYAGTPLAGPSTRPVAGFTARDALAVRVRLVSLESMPASFGKPLGLEARLIAATRLGVPVLPSSRLTRGTRTAMLDEGATFESVLPAEAGRTAAIGEVRLALPVGVTASLSASEAISEVADLVAGGTLRRGVELSLHRPAARQVVLALTIDDLADPEPELTSDDEPADGPGASTRPAAEPAALAPQRELAILELAMPASRLAMAVVVPMQFGQGEGKGTAAIFEIVEGADDPEHALAVTTTLEDIRRTAREAATRPLTPPVASSEWAGMLVAVSVLDLPERRRTALAYLTGQSGANFCSDVVLTADELVLADLADAVRAAVKALPGPLSVDGMGWLLDRAAFEHTARLMSKETLPDELRAVLAFHFGEAGRQAGSMEEVARGLGSRRDFDTKLIEENFIFLEDSSPSSRVRAYDWLNARKLAPAGYDPLGDPRERRKAIERALTPPGNVP